ncbi:hypothetical protein NDU88_010568, partial [Pleurodeles waltl]
ARQKWRKLTSAHRRGPLIAPMTSGGATWSRAIVTSSPRCRAGEKFPSNAMHGENSL